MLRTLTLLAALLLLAGIAYAQAPKAKAAPKAAATDQAIMDKEKQLWDAWKNHDPAPFKEALTEDMAFVDANGTVGKTEFLDSLAQQPCQVKNVSLSDMKVVPVDNNSATVTYKADLDGTCNGQPVPPAFHSTVYTKKAGKWMVAFHQFTEARPQQ